MNDTVQVFGMPSIGEEKVERAILVGIELPHSDWSMESSLEELARLVETAGAEVVATLSQKISSPNPKTFIGSGKAEELALLARELEADLVVFDEELTPSQQNNLEKAVDETVKVIDRTALILDIFALHATSKEGRLQVRLAQNEYLLPRLRGMWAHLASNRMGGGVGSRFGEGESQLEVDRRMVRKRINRIQNDLKHLSEVREVQRESRYSSGIFKVVLAGYTNAGKSSLLNTLTDSDVLAYDKLFATLDSTTRKYLLPEGREITLTDTVGFIQKLPTTLVEAFKSTLDEINGSNLILHVVDASAKDSEKQMEAVDDILGQIGAQDISRLLVFNKIDLIDADQKEALMKRFEKAIFLSVKTKEGLESLISAIARVASASDTLIHILLPYNKGALVSLAHERCRILTEEYTENGTKMGLLVPHNLKNQFAEYILTEE